MSAKHTWRLMAALTCLGAVMAEDTPQLPVPGAEPRLLLKISDPSEPAPGASKPAAAIVPPSMPQELPAGAPTAPGDAGASPPAMVPTVPFSSKTPSSTSTTKQFTVYGGDLELRGAFCMLCEETAASLGRVLKDAGQWVLPVIVVLKTPPDISPTGPAVTLNIGELTHGGFHLQINAHLRTGFRTSDFKRELVRVLLAERILRNHQKLSTTRKNDVLPAWVMTGVDQAMEYRSRSRPSALFSAVFHNGQVYSLDRILAADPAQLDALSRGIYETSTCALVLTLLDQPDGPVRFSRFLNALAVESKPDRALLTQFFPNLASSGSAFEKWWSLQMASLATPGALESLGSAQTEEELDKALTLVIPGARREEASKSASAPAPKQEPAPKEEPKEQNVEEKKSSGFFGWLKRGSKGESGAEEKKDGNAAEKKTPDAPKDTPVTPGAKGGRAEVMWPAFGLPGLEEGIALLSQALPYPFDGGREVFLGFGKKKKADEAAEDAGRDEKAEPKKPDAPKTEASKSDARKPEGKKPAAKPEAAQPAKAESSKPKVEESTPSLSRKEGQPRSVSERPGDLPKAPPAAPEKKEVPVKAESPATASKGGLPQRSPKPETADSKPSAAESKAKPVSKPEPPKAAPKPEPATTRTARAGSIPLEEYALIAKRADREDILKRCLARLEALKVRAHPLYRALISDYGVVVADLINGKTKGAATRLEELHRQRGTIHGLAVAVETHLDWYEANHTGALSHQFDDFLRLDESMEKDWLPRSDALSKYLDAVENEYK